MPRERVHHGKLYASYTLSHEDAEDLPPMTAVSSSTDSPGVEVSVEYRPDDSSIPKNARVRAETSLDVSWNRDPGWVQVSLDIPRDKWESNAEWVAENKDLSSFPMYTDALTREEINHMIKTLRRARDAAFGADQ